MGLLFGENCIIPNFKRFWLIHLCDRRTNGQTELPWHICTIAYLLSHIKTEQNFLGNPYANTPFQIHSVISWYQAFDCCQNAPKLNLDLKSNFKNFLAASTCTSIVGRGWVSNHVEFEFRVRVSSKFTRLFQLDEIDKHDFKIALP